jgi:hypothetical protein
VTQIVFQLRGRYSYGRIASYKAKYLRRLMLLIYLINGLPCSAKFATLEPSVI